MNSESSKPKVTYRISTIIGILMVSVALIYDIAQALLTFIGIGFLVNWIITLWANLTFWFWFTLHGISFWSPKRAGIMGVGNLIEWIPGLNALPACSAAVLLLWLNTRAEDVLAQVSPIAVTIINKASKFKK